MPNEDRYPTVIPFYKQLCAHSDYCDVKQSVWMKTDRWLPFRTLVGTFFPLWQNSVLFFAAMQEK